MMTLKVLGITKDVYHCNEGHAALINIQRLCDYINGLEFRTGHGSWYVLPHFILYILLCLLAMTISMKGFSINI